MNSSTTSEPSTAPDAAEMFIEFRLDQMMQSVFFKKPKSRLTKVPHVSVSWEVRFKSRTGGDSLAGRICRDRLKEQFCFIGADERPTCWTSSRTEVKKLAKNQIRLSLRQRVVSTMTEDTNHV